MITIRIIVIQAFLFRMPPTWLLSQTSQADYSSGGCPKRHPFLSLISRGDRILNLRPSSSRTTRATKPALHPEKPIKNLKGPYFKSIYSHFRRQFSGGIQIFSSPFFFCLKSETDKIQWRFKNTSAKLILFPNQQNKEFLSKNKIIID